MAAAVAAVAIVIAMLGWRSMHKPYYCTVAIARVPFFDVNNIFFIYNLSDLCRYEQIYCVKQPLNAADSTVQRVVHKIAKANGSVHCDVCDFPVYIIVLFLNHHCTAIRMPVGVFFYGSQRMLAGGLWLLRNTPSHAASVEDKYVVSVEEKTSLVITSRCLSQPYQTF